MKITCSLKQSQIEKLYANIYGHLLDSQNKGKTFDSKGYMINLFNKIASKGDVETAAKFLQQVPTLIGTASFRPSLEELGLPTDMLRPLIKSFKNEDAGLLNVVSYFNPTLNINVQQELIDQSEKNAFVVPENDSETVEKDPFDYLPYESFSTTFQEFLTVDPDKAATSEQLDVNRKVIYATLRELKKTIGTTPNLGKLVYQNVTLKLVPQRLDTAVTDELDKTTKRLQNRSEFLNKKGMAQPNVTKPNEIFLMIISNEAGKPVYFNDEGSITTKEEGGKQVYQFLRDARKKGDRYAVTDIYGKDNQILNAKELATLINKNSKTKLSKEAFNDLVAELDKKQQEEFKQLFNFRQRLIKGETPLINITDVSQGVKEYTNKEITLNNIRRYPFGTDHVFKTIQTIKTPRGQFKKGEATITIEGQEFKIDRPNLTDDLIKKIATVLTDKNLSKEVRYNFYSQFLADKVSPSTRKHTLSFTPITDELLFSYSKKTFQEGYDSKFTDVMLDSDTAYTEIYDALKLASGKNGNYFSAKMTYNKDLLNINGYQDYNLDTKELSEDFIPYIPLLETLPNTKVDASVTSNPRFFNSYMKFALPNEFTKQLEEAQNSSNDVEKDDFFETLSAPSDVENLMPSEKKKVIVDTLKSNKKIVGTITKPFGSETKWKFVTAKGTTIDFYSHTNNITDLDTVAQANLNLLPEVDFNGKVMTDVVEVRIGDKVIGYVRETDQFDKVNIVEPTKSQEEIDAEIEEKINPKNTNHPSGDSLFFTRSGDLANDVTESDIKDAHTWWAKSDLTKHIGFKEAVNIVNSDAYARFMTYGATLNGTLGTIEIANKGSMVDVYHEAWHGFSQLYLTISEKKALYKEVQKKLGNKKLSFFEIEEMLAEDFRSFAKDPKAAVNSPKRNSLFRKILNFLRELFGKGSVTNVRDIKKVQELFDNLYLNKNLNKYTPTIDNVMFDLLYRNSGIVKPGTLTDQVLSRQDSNLVKDSMDSIISELVDSDNNIKGNKSGTLAILLDSRNRDELYKLININLNKSLSHYKTTLEKLEDKVENENTKEVLENRIRILQAAVDNYGNSKSGVIQYHIENSTFDLIKQKYTTLELDEEGNLFDPNNTDNTERYGDTKVGEKSLIQLAGKETLYILKSLHKIVNGKVEYNELGYKKLAPFRTTWNNTVRAISGLQDPQEMYDKLVEESKVSPEFKQLTENKLANPLNSKNSNEQKAITSFWQDFNKPRVPYIQFTIFKKTDDNPNGSSEVTEASIETKTVINKFQNKFKADITSPYIKRIGKENIPTLDISEIVKDFSDANGNLDISKSYEFARAIGFYLDDIGIIINTLKKDETTIQQFGLPYIFNAVKVLDRKDKLPVKSALVSKWINKFKTNPVKTLTEAIPVGVIGADVFKQKNKVEALARLQGRYGVDSSNFGVLNAERNLVFEHIDNNSITKIVYALNNAEKLSDLWESDKFNYTKYLDPKINSFTNRSGILRSLFDMRDPKKSKLTDRDLELFMNSGTQVEQSAVGLNTTSLDVNSKMLQEMNTMLKGGVQEFMRHASKSSSFGARINGGIVGKPGKQGSDERLWVDLDMFAKNIAHDYAFTAHLLPYMESEAERIFKCNSNLDTFKNYAGYNRKLSSGRIAGQEFTAFDNVLTDPTKELIYTAIDKAIKNKELFNLGTFLKNNPTLLSTVKKETAFYFANQTDKNLTNLIGSNYISPSLREKLNVFNITKAAQDKVLVDAYTYNAWIHNFETASLFYGDIVQYNHDKEEMHKRNTGATSGGRTFRTDISAQKFANGYLADTSYAKKHDFTPISYNGTFNTAIIKDIERTSIYYPDYEKALREDYTKRFSKVLDKSKVAAAVEERVAKEIVKYKDMEEGDGQGWITFDAYRLLKTNENSWSNAQEVLFQKINNNQPIASTEITEMFPVYKLQNFGHLANTDLLAPINAMHKFALMPLIPSMIEGSDLESLHQQMMSKNIQYLTFKTGSKVGSVTSNGKADEIYDAKSDQKILKTDIKFTPNTIYVDYLKNVTAVPSKFKNKTVFSTQLRKLILGNLYEKGEIINPSNTKAIKEYEAAVAHHSNLLKLELLNEIGYEYDAKNNKYYGNVDKFLDVVQAELEKRDLPEHLIQMVGLTRDKSLRTDLSLHLKADEIEKILVALVEKRLIKQKVKGEALVQVSSAMTNSIWDLKTKLKNATVADIKKYMGSNNLPFYHQDASGNTLAMKVAIALQGDFVNLLKLNHLDGQPIGTRARLNDMIKEDKWLDINDNRKAVTLSAVRIPVQGLNSMEFMEVYEFLDPAAGNIIIPPSEIVAKSGADFDVDKLTTFMPHIDYKGNYVKGQLSNDELLKKVNKLNETPEGKKLATNLIKSQKSASENNLIATIRGILELKDNFASLIRPNDTYLLKEIADDLQEHVTDYDRFGNVHDENRTGLKNQKVISPTRVLEAGYNLHKHEANMVGKRVLGIIAVENALHPIFNAIGAAMPKTYKESSYVGNKYIDGEIDYDTRILLPTNMTKDGRISLSGTETSDGMDNIGELFSQMLNGAVDVEKDAWIFFIQGNYELIPMLTFLFKAGVPKEQAIMFVSQPLVREYAKQQREVKSAYATLTGVVPEDYNPMFAKYTAAQNTLEGKNLNSVISKATGLKIKDALSLQGDTEIKFAENKVYQTKKASTILKEIKDGTIDPTKITYMVNNKTGEKIFKPIGKHPVSNANFYYTAKAATENKKEFSLEELKKNVVNNDSTSPQAIAAFLHLLEIEKSSKGFSVLKMQANPDTKTSKTIQEIIKRNLSLEDIKELSKLEPGLVEKLQTSILGTFFDNKLIKDLVVPVFQLRNNDVVTSTILKLLDKNSNSIAEKFGKGQDGASQFITQFKNAIPNYIYQNYMSHFIDEAGNLTDSPTEFNELTVKNVAGTTNGAKVVGNTIYVDTERLRNEFENKLYTRESALEGNYKESGLRGFKLQDDMFPNLSSYVRYVYEREYQRHLYSVDSLKTNKDYLKFKSDFKTAGVDESKIPELAYEAYLNQRALINAFNREAIMGMEDYSYTDMVLNMVEEFSNLKHKYPIVNQFTKPKVVTRNIHGQLLKENYVLTLNDVKELKDGQLAEVYYQNIKDLGDETVKKVSNIEDNKRISKLFSLLPMMMIYQHGLGYSKYGFNEALPYNDFIGVMQTAADIYEDKILNEESLNTIYKLLMNENNANFKDYVAPRAKDYKSPVAGEFSNPVVTTVEELDDNMRALLMKNAVPADQPSTSVEPTDIVKTISPNGKPPIERTSSDCE